MNEPAATEEDPAGVEVLVSCAGVRSTGKRHNSFFFTFRVEKEIRGELGQDEYASQEIFWDFGAGQLRGCVALARMPR